MIRSAAAMMALLVCGVTTAATINVPADYTTIQAAIDAASDGDEVIVAPGTYTGGVDSVVNLVGKSITLRASGTPEATVIDGENLRRGFYINGGSAIVDGFMITRGYAPGEDTYPFENYGGGVYCPSGSPTITNCIISGNTAPDSGSNYGSGGGIFFTGASSPTITDCVILNNTATSGGGITGWGTGGSSPTITDCVISNNTANMGGGMYTAGRVPTVTGCTISDNTANWGIGGGIYCTGGGPTLTDTVLCGNTSDQIHGSWTDGGGNTIAEICSSYQGACCIGQSCSVTTEANCGGDYLGDGTNCDGNPCYVPPTGACCINESCTVTTEAACSGDWLGEGTGCSGNPCYVPPTGACCTNGSCSIETEADCGGDWLGEATDCSGNPCYVPPTGACCINESCYFTTEAACSGDWLGEGGSCDDCTPDCPDVSGDGFVAVHDLLAVLEAWNSDDPDADVDGDGLVGMDDLAAVIDAWGPCE